MHTHFSGCLRHGAMDRCVLKGEVHTQLTWLHSTRACQGFSQIIHIHCTVQDSRQDSGSHPLWRGCTAYLKVVRWQKNEETLGTATAASQRLPGLPPALCVWIKTHLKINQDTLKSSKQTVPRSVAEWCSAKHKAAPSLNTCEHENSISDL